MERKTKRQLLVWSIIILILINIASLGTIWFNKFGNRHRGHDRGWASERFERGRDGQKGFSKRDRLKKLHNALGLSEEQSKSVDSVFDIHAESRRINMEKMAEMKQALNDELRQSELNQEMIDSLLQKQTELFEEGNNQIIKLSMSLREILTEEQRVKFSDYMERSSRSGRKGKF